MKWALAGVGLLVIIVVFSFAALDQKDVVWTGGKPHCPHCRSEVEACATVCPACRHGFDWQGHEIICSACLSELDAEHYRERFEKHEDELKAALKEKGATGEQVGELLDWFKSIRAGACGFCGGTGKWLAKGFGPPSTPADCAALHAMLLRENEGACPVCFGTGRCILCDGRHLVTVGRETAAVELDAMLDRLSRLDRHRDEASAEQVFLEVRNYVRKQAGREEILRLPAFDRPQELHLPGATLRLDFLRAMLDSLPE
jgi:hypothetical protein